MNKKVIFYCKKMPKAIAELKKVLTFAVQFGRKANAEVTQLIERQPSKLKVAGLSPVFRSRKEPRLCLRFFFYLEYFLYICRDVFGRVLTVTFACLA